MSDGVSGPCEVSGYQCEAPGGWLVGSAAGEGSKRPRSRCFRCGMPVCKQCSRVTTCLPGFAGKKRRACHNCLADCGLPEVLGE